MDTKTDPIDHILAHRVAPIYKKSLRYSAVNKAAFIIPIDGVNPGENGLIHRLVKTYLPPKSSSTKEHSNI